MGVFISLFALPFVAAGVGTAWIAVRAWIHVSVLPCCAPAARACDGCAARDSQRLGRVGVHVSSFAIGWNAAVFMMLLPQIPQAWHDSIGFGVFLSIFSIPFLAAGVYKGVKAVVP